MSDPFDIAVIGSGLAGLTAAHHAALGGASVVNLEGHLLGGLVTNVGELDGYPLPEPAAGITLAAALLERNMGLGVDWREGAVTALVPGAPHRLALAGGELAARAVIVASGARLKRLGVDGEARLDGHGVSQCAFCDGGLFNDKAVVVVGGGDAAFQEALHLAQHASRITMVLRGERPRARRAYVTRAADDPKFEFRWRTTVEAIAGEAAVGGVRLRSLENGGTEDLPCAGVFVFIGLEPATEFMPGAAGALAVDASLATTLPGVFAAGAARAGHGGSLAEAVADGTLAARSALAWIEGLGGANR
jgi:thioredoxin reductase (NADPH)